MPRRVIGAVERKHLQAMGFLREILADGRAFSPGQILSAAARRGLQPFHLTDAYQELGITRRSPDGYWMLPSADPDRITRSES
jgi:hypothetical protein